MARDEVTPRLAPQMGDYDRLGGQIDWRPYLMYFQPPNFASPAVTTDRLGFRPTVDRTGRRVTIDDVGGETVNLVIGNSVSFGVGATSDAACLTSRIASHTGECWFDFSGRAFGAMQELVLFQSYRHKLGRVRRVVLFTGLNDLYLFYAPKMFDEVFGIFFFSEAFYAAMNRRPQALTNKRALLAALLKPFYGDGIDYATVSLAQLPRLLLRPPKKDPPATEPDYGAIVGERRGQRDRIIEHLARTLEIWAMLARGFDFELTYALQPILPWTGKTLSPEERELLAAQDAAGGRWHRILRAALDRDHQDWYTAALAGLCARFGIPFVDLGLKMRDERRWLFIDRVHMNDAGQDLAARLVAQQCGPGQAFAPGACE
jgi:hypothetical protein